MNVVLANHTRSGARLRLEKKVSLWGGTSLPGMGEEIGGMSGGMVGGRSPGQDLQIKIKSLFLFFFPRATLLVFTVRRSQTEPSQTKSTLFVLHG